MGLTGLDAVDLLFAGDPSEFVAARDALAKARRKPRQPRSTTPLTFTWGVVIAIVVVTALVVSGMSALSALLVAGTLKITLTAFWWSILWGIIAGGLAGLGMAIVNRAIARARTI